MLFKLSVKNFKKSVKDYAIYFTTLVLGIAIFYVFNALDSQQAMAEMQQSKKEIIKLMIQNLNGVSVFVSCILAFLIIYANNFLIKRRKKEFGVYLMLGMGKGQISRILVGETFLIGMLSLGAGLAIGVLGSQFMSILIVKLFEEAMEKYTFVFSEAAFFKTILYFCIMLFLVFLFNIILVSKCRLIDLIFAKKKTEQVKIKNPVLCVLLFLCSTATLAGLYYLVSVTPEKLELSSCGIVILVGILSTFVFFWSLSGFFLETLKRSKKFYLKNLNMFVMRQLNSKINTTVTAMTIICIMLFLTICVLSSGLGLNYTFRNSLNKLTPADVNLFYSPPEGADPSLSVREVIGEDTFSSMRLKEGYAELSVYGTSQLTIETSLGEHLQMLTDRLLFLKNDTKEDIVKLSEYNQLAKLYGHKEYELEADEYLIICNFDIALEVRNLELANEKEIVLDGVTYKPVSPQCEDGFIEMTTNSSNAGFYVFPDEAVEESWAVGSYLAGNYGMNDKDAVDKLETQLDQIPGESGVQVATRNYIKTSSIGLSALITFMAIYLGIIFLICGAAILALKELSESSDNKERYEILEKIGVSEKMIHSALFRQIGVFFLLPLGLAIVHSIFGLEFIHQVILQNLGDTKSFATILSTAIVLVLVYGGYFLVTYLGSKRIIHGK